MFRATTMLLLAGLTPLLTACGGEEPAPNAFEAQTEAIDKATDAVRQLEDAAAAQRAAIDRQSQ